MNRVLSINIAGILFLLGFTFFQNCFEFELKLYESHLTSYYFAGLSARILISLYFVATSFWLLQPRTKLLKPVTFVLFMIAIYLELMSMLTDPIIQMDMLIFIPSFLHIWVLIVGVVMLSIFGTKKTPNHSKARVWLVSNLVLSAGAVAIVFILNPLFLDEFTNESQPFGSTEILETDLEDMERKSELRAYFSTSCPYCEMASKRLMVLSKNYPNFPPVKLYFFGSQEGVDWFLEDTKTEFDFEIMETEQFLRITSGSFPKFIHIKNGSPNLLYSGRTFNYLSPDVISAE